MSDFWTYPRPPRGLLDLGPEDDSVPSLYPDYTLPFRPSWASNSGPVTLPMPAKLPSFDDPDPYIFLSDTASGSGSAPDASSGATNSVPGVLSPNFVPLSDNGAPSAPNPDPLPPLSYRSTSGFDSSTANAAPTGSPNPNLALPLAYGSQGSPGTSSDPWSAFDTIAPGYGTGSWQNLMANTPASRGLLGPISPEVQRQIDIGSRAAAIYGETGAFRPQLIDPDISANDPTNWDSDSAAQLHQARTNLGAMYGTVNKVMSPGSPDDIGNPIQKQQWDLAMAAARDSFNIQLDPRLKKMYMRQDGVGYQEPPDSWQERSRILPMGPFVNTAPASAKAIQNRRAIPEGPRAFVDFYGR